MGPHGVGSHGVGPHSEAGARDVTSMARWGGPGTAEAHVWYEHETTVSRSRVLEEACSMESTTGRLWTGSLHFWPGGVHGEGHSKTIAFVLLLTPNPALFL